MVEYMAKEKSETQAKMLVGLGANLLKVTQKNLQKAKNSKIKQLADERRESERNLRRDDS